ncbi:mitochondrial K+-H+ exchange-related-domain-containing protein [Rhodocollybia butyracea]|uniref:Mitochondrial K+-H+ exchange-related-domain-containing protein n=1 Tax=Rhodocollybia butyracea TaxID=206335 RepID=A0A9P5QA37_9AGAR|nr:mitochondrial K+-H+ exchange-related-domain-containing protein [Rhodocollybia butyracea]
MASLKNVRSVQRIISFPITRPRKSSNFQSIPGSSSSKPLTYYKFQVHLPKSTNSEVEGAHQSRWQPKGGWIHWTQTKAASTWASFGSAENASKGNWKFKVFQTGERLVDRLDYEELALKGVDPSMGPTIRNPDIRGKGSDENDEKQKVLIPLLYPPSIHSAESSLAHLRQLVQSREPRHKKGFWMWMIIAPFTAPFMIIPIIPNLPFFFCVWRSWSHYQAYRSSQYLSALIKHGHVVASPSAELDALYLKFGLKTLPLPTTQSPPNEESEPQSATGDAEMLLTREAVPSILSTFSLEDGAASDLYRAIEQARVRTNRAPE